VSVADSPNDRYQPWPKTNGCNAELGASLPAHAAPTSPNDGCQRSERLVYRRSIWEHVEDCGIDDYDIGAVRVAGCSCAADSSREIVLTPQFVAIGCSVAASSSSLHIASALVWSPAG